MRPIGPKLAEGRDSEIFEHGPGRVLRLARDGRSLTGEAEVMRYARDHGFPCPEVHDAGDGFLVMERLDGPTLVQRAGRPPFPIRSSGRVLAELHRRLHAIPAPPNLRRAPVAGDRLVHLDLHPLNVMMTGAGPIVIDWSNAAAGDPALDVADTWVVLACSAPPVHGVDRLVVPLGRRILLHAFLAGVDETAARSRLAAAAELRLHDSNTTPAEADRMRRLARTADATR